LGGKDSGVLRENTLIDHSKEVGRHGAERVGVDLFDFGGERGKIGAAAVGDDDRVAVGVGEEVIGVTIESRVEEKAHEGGARGAIG
jgi:hypothetical protein